MQPQSHAPRTVLGEGRDLLAELLLRKESEVLLEMFRTNALQGADRPDDCRFAFVRKSAGGVGALPEKYIGRFASLVENFENRFQIAKVAEPVHAWQTEVRAHAAGNVAQQSRLAIRAVDIDAQNQGHQTLSAGQDLHW